MRGMVLALLLSGCSSLEISAGKAISADWWEGDPPLVRVAARQEWNNGFCEVAHTSNLGSGWPANGDAESYLDTITCGIRIKWNATQNP